MPLPTITIVTLHGALLMVILLMLLPPINGLYRWFPYLNGLHKGQNTSKNYVTKYPELFQYIPNLAELPLVRYALWSKFSMITTTSRLFQWDPMLITKILLLTKVTLKSFQKKRKILHYAIPSFSHTFFALVMIYYTLPCFGTKSEIYYSPITIHCYYSSITVHDTIHSEFLPISRGLSLMFEASFSRA